MIRDKRLSEWAKQHGLRAKGQAGFCKNYHAIDQLFILWTLIKQNKAKKKPFYYCFMDFKGVRYSAVWSVMAGVGWPQGGGTLLTMLPNDVCQGYNTHQPPERGYHHQLQVPVRCEARLPFQPLTVWVIFGCLGGPLGRQRMWCTSPSRCARMDVVFCRWTRSDVGVRGGTATTVRCTPIVLCWTWAYRECGKNKSHGVQLWWPMPRICVERWRYWMCVDLQILGDPARNHPKPGQWSGTSNSC
jgi:hypothetical protein